MKKVLFSAALPLLAAALLAGNQGTVGVPVEEAEAAALYGGACENGWAVFQQGACGVQGQPNTPFYGCLYNVDYDSNGAAGSWVATSSNCGVFECGIVDKPKSCG